MERADEVTRVSNLLYDAMTRAGLSITDLSSRSGISRSIVSRVVNGKGSCTIYTFAVLLNACGREMRTGKRDSAAY